MPGCASEMDLHTPASSGYIHKAPAGNLSSGEKQQHTHSVFNCRENTNTHTLFFCLLLLVCLPEQMHSLFMVSSHKLNPNAVKVQVAGNARMGQIRPAGIPLIHTC